jgi:hypothetical protein
MKNMKSFLLATGMLIQAGLLQAQAIITTVSSGNYNDGAIWSTGTVPTGDCGCTLQIKPGNQVTINSPISVSNVAIELQGSGSEILFSGTNDLTLGGTASIDVQNNSARIFSNNANNSIFLSGTEIYTGNTTMINSSVPGEVLGPASASSERSDPNFINGTLPVKLVSFTASGDKNTVSLNWITSAEINSDAFLVERSADSKAWSNIGNVKASGNASADQQYQYADASPLTGINFYRLKIVDRDGKFEFSPIKSVNIASAGWVISAGPNPARSTLNISVNQPGHSAFRLKIYNQSGQVVYDRQHAGETHRISIQTGNYAEGVYVLELNSGGGLRLTNKIIVSRK